jgi:hypothetical protein
LGFWEFGGLEVWRFDRLKGWVLGESELKNVKGEFFEKGRVSEKVLFFGKLKLACEDLVQVEIGFGKLEKFFGLRNVKLNDFGLG